MGSSESHSLAPIARGYPSSLVIPSPEDSSSNHRDCESQTQAIFRAPQVPSATAQHLSIRTQILIRPETFLLSSSTGPLQHASAPNSSSRPPGALRSVTSQSLIPYTLPRHDQFVVHIYVFSVRIVASSTDHYQ